MSVIADLHGKTAVVTGASSGIGRATAEVLGSAGAHVFLSGRTAAAMQDSKAKIEAAGGKADVVTMDVRRIDDVRALVEQAVAATGRLDIMVNNAGVSFPSSIAEADPEDWRTMLETNILALLVGCQAAVRAMRQCATAGHIVNISSIAAHRRDSGVYGATKHAVNCISATLRQELEKDRIRVVTIMPGAIATNFARNFDPDFLKSLVAATGVEAEVTRGERLPDEVLEKIQPLMQDMLCSPEEVADTVLYAVSLPIHVNIEELVVRPAQQLPL